jgi:hypothetical protein
MVVGLVAAVIFLTLNPPGDAWPALVGTALAAGVGGEAVLLAIIASRRAQAAEIGRARAVVEVKDTHDAWADSIRTFESVTQAAARRGVPVGGVSDAAEEDGLLDVVNAYAMRALTEIERRSVAAVR